MGSTSIPLDADEFPGSAAQSTADVARRAQIVLLSPPVIRRPWRRWRPSWPPAPRRGRLRWRWEPCRWPTRRPPVPSWLRAASTSLTLRSVEPDSRPADADPRGVLQRKPGRPRTGGADLRPGRQADLLFGASATARGSSSWPTCSLRYIPWPRREAHQLGSACGLDPDLVQEVIAAGVGSSAMFEIRGPMMAADTYEPPSGPPRHHPERCRHHRRPRPKPRLPHPPARRRHPPLPGCRRLRPR